jgi:hypothetical protein
MEIRIMADEWVFSFSDAQGGSSANQVTNILGSSTNIELGIEQVEHIKPTSSNIAVSEMLDSMINNYGQGSHHTIHALPVAAANMRAMFIAGTDPGGTYVYGFRAASGDKIYLNGVAGDDGDAVMVEPTVGDQILVESFKTGVGVWDWVAITYHGSWAAAVWLYTRITTTGDRRVTSTGDIRVLA